MDLKHTFKRLKRVWSLVSAFLYLTDIMLDAMQCKTYYDFAFEESSEDIKVSKWYFICSMVTWAGPPVCLILFWYISYLIDPSFGHSHYEDYESKKIGIFNFSRPPWDKKDLELNTEDNEETTKDKTEFKNLLFIWYILVVPWKFLWDSIMALFYVYFYTPILVARGLLTMEWW